MEKCDSSWSEGFTPYNLCIVTCRMICKAIVYIFVSLHLMGVDYKLWLKLAPLFQRRFLK
jgi:hypothetical protein